MATRTAVYVMDRHGWAMSAASRVACRTPLKMMSHSSAHTTSRRRFGGMPSKESDGHDCHGYPLPSLLPDVTTSGRRRVSNSRRTRCR